MSKAVGVNSLGFDKSDYISLVGDIDMQSGASCGAEIKRLCDERTHDDQH